MGTVPSVASSSGMTSCDPSWSVYQRFFLSMSANLDRYLTSIVTERDRRVYVG